MALTKNALDLAPAGTWFKSSYSNAGNNCVEVTTHLISHGLVGVRDSKAQEGPALQFRTAAFATFVADVAEGRYGA